MATIPTATGTIDSADLGRTLAHEHVFVLGAEYQQNYQDWDEDARVADAVTALAGLKSLGIDSILDPTVLGLGRYVPRVRRIAEQVDLNIVVATGLYTFSDLPFQFRDNGPGLLFDMPEPLTELFVRDLTEGIGDTGVRAAFLKCAIDKPGLTPGVERTLRAVGQAHVRTGAPVMVHTNPHTRSGSLAQRVLAEEGVDLSKVLLAHCGDTADVDHLTELADAGSLLGMDRFGLDLLLPFEQRVDTIVRLFERGYGDQVVIAHDASCHIDWYTPEDLARVAPRWHYRHISEEVLPALKARGLSDGDLDTILTANPRRLFE